MAQAPQAAMEMPQQAANPYEDPNTMAIYDQMRQSVSPKQFGDEVLAGASQVDPQEVAKFRDALDQIEMPPEALDLLNNMVDEILANPEKYDEIRAKYKEMGAPDEILPEQFDPQFFSALNMAVDQMIGAPAGPEAFAKGGIAELTPVSKAIAGYGRNGDTMLAHITPAEARMLRRKGGSGTINPKTGMPEFFNLFKSIGNAFKSVGNAVKGFVNSTVGKIVTTVALGFFLGPAAASFLGVSSAAGVAAVSGFVGGAGSTLLGGGNLSQALKAGALGGLTAGAGAGIMGGSEAFTSGSYTGPTTVSGQYEKLMGAPAAPVGPAAPSISPTGQVAGMAPTPNPADATQFEGSLAKAPVPTEPSYLDKAKDFYNKNLSPSGIQEQGAASAIETVQKTFPTATADQIMNAPAGSALAKAYSAALPGTFATYAPLTAAGIGALGLAGGFKPSAPEASKLKPELMKSATQRIAEQGKQKEYYLQNLPGVKYDESGAPIYGQNTPWPTTPASTTPPSNFNLPSTVGGIGSLYMPPPGTIGTQKPIPQPYNTASMYTNLMAPPPRGFADGGDVTPPPESAAMVEAQRAAMIAQAQALGQTGYTPASPGRYGIDQGAYTPSTGFAGFTQQYMRDNPTVTPTISRPTAAAAGGVDNPVTGTTVQPPVELPQPAVYQPPVDNPPVEQPPVDYPPVDQTPTTDPYEDTPINTPYVPPTPAVDPYEDTPINTPYTPPAVDPYEDATIDTPYTPSTSTVDPYEDAYTPPADVYTPPADAYTPPAAEEYPSYQPTVYEAPSYNAPAYEAPAYEAPAYEAPAYEAPAYEAPAYEAPAYEAPSYDSYNTGGGGGYGNTMQDSYSDFGGFGGGGFGEFDYSSFNTGGIASLNAGGYPRRTGQVSGPGTATSDSIPAMLSDGEFVMTAKAVRGAGKGDRRAGAKRMYALMHQLEQNASRG